MLKVLIADDESAIREGLARMIAKIEDCQVVDTATNGEEALEKIGRLAPDIVITDIKMPKIDGLALAKRIHEEYPQTKVIILTGYPDFNYARQAISYRVVEFVLKPTTVENLSAAIERARVQLGEGGVNTRELLKYKQNIFFYDMLYSNNSTLYSINKMNDLGIQMGNYATLLLSVSPGKDELLAAVKGKLEALLDKVYFIDKNDQQFYVISSEIEKLATAAEAIVADNATNEEYSVTLGISSGHIDILQLQKAANEAENALKFAFYADETAMVHYKNIPQITDAAREQSIKYLELLKSSMESKDIASARINFHLIFDYMRQEKMPFDEIKKFCIIIHNFCMSTLYNYSILSTMEDILDLDCLFKQNEGLEKALLSFIERVIVFIDQNPYYIDNIVLTIKNYIDVNYKNEISLESLAAKAHFSPSYLSKLFKKQVGENISTYLQTVRINKAKQLLKTTSMKTYEVAEAVGIDDPVYFSRIFKKITGLKPKDFKIGLDETDRL